MLKRRLAVIFFILGVLSFIVGASAYLAYLSYYGYITMPNIPFLTSEDEINRNNRRKELLELSEEPEPAESTETVVSAAVPEMSADERALMKESAQPGFELIDNRLYTYIGIDNLMCTSEADGGYTVCTLSSGRQVHVCGYLDGFFCIHVSDGTFAYAPVEKFMEGAAYAAIENAVDLRGSLPEAIFSLDFSRSDNIAGRTLYPGIPFMEKNTAELLEKAYMRFKSDGYLLKIYDAYRPVSAQHALYDILPDSRYIANPSYGYSWHNVGKAVDITLVDAATGEEIEMPSAVYTFDETSARYGRMDWSETVRNNVDYMTGIMTSLGFTTLDTEWWHFEYREQKDIKMDQNIDYYEVIYEPAG